MDLLIQVNLKNHNGHVGDKLPMTILVCRKRLTTNNSQLRGD